MAQLIDLTQLKEMALAARAELRSEAAAMGRDVKIYLHWTAGGYNQVYNDYHICITGDGCIYTTTEDFSETLNHTWKRNTGSIGIALCGAYGAGSQSLGDYPPTAAQIEALAQTVAVLCLAIGIPADRQHVLTHGEAANNEDGLHPHEPYAWWNDSYGDGDTRGDLKYLGTAESPSYNPWATDGSRGGDVLRGKINYYINQFNQ